MTSAKYLAVLRFLWMSSVTEGVLCSWNHRWFHRFADWSSVYCGWM